MTVTGMRLSFAIQKQKQLLTASISRPDLFSTLLTSIEHAIHAITANPGDLQARLVLDRALLYWHEATKVLSQNKMLRGKQIMGSVSSNSRFGLRATRPLTLLSTVVRKRHAIVDSAVSTSVLCGVLCS